ncbi:MAG: hypothetical protein IJ836_02870 [Spirochaetales bacterium]|nr:hypothetical protein [Spirochaetales bacterium]
MKRGASVFIHILIVPTLLMLILVVPFIKVSGILKSRSDLVNDAVSSASLALPDQPSGVYFVIMNRDLHGKNMKEWKSFFSDDEFAVIFDDVSCLVAFSDNDAFTLSQRYQAQLPENQMRVREMNPVLLASKVENGIVDMAVFSEGMASALKLDLERIIEMERLEIIRIGE